jgi:phage baseplate assembly protein W
VPKLKVPFNISSTKADVVEQDSADEVFQCVGALIRTDLGSRIDEPEYGIQDQTFKEQLDDLFGAIEEWEPRAMAVLAEDELDGFIRSVFINVDSKER